MEHGHHSRPVSSEIYHCDAVATNDYPDYPEEVALYSSSRVSSTPSVTGLDGPGSTRVFDVFGDENTGQSDEHDHRQLLENLEERTLQNSPIPSIRSCQHPARNTTKVTKSRGKRMSQPLAKASTRYVEDGHGGNHLAAFENVIRYLRRFYDLTTAEAKFSNGFSDSDSLKEDLAVVQLATRTLQHAYGIIATSTTTIDDAVPQPTIIKARQTITRKEWSPEDEQRLVELRDSQKLSWSCIQELFPERTVDAVRQRYAQKTSKKSESSSRKKNRSNPSGQHVRCISSARRSQRLAQASQVAGMRNDADRHRRYPSRAVKNHQKPNAREVNVIDPALRNLR